MSVKSLAMRALGTTLGVCASAGTVTAQHADTLRAKYLLPLPQIARNASEVTREIVRTSPGITYSSPSAFGPGWGDGFIGLGYQQRERYAHIQDGFVSGGIGLGNPYKYVGLELDMVSVSTVRSGFFKRDAWSFKFHRMLTSSSSIAAGWENAVTTRNGLDGGNSMYVVATNIFHRTSSPRDPFSSLTVTVGAGNGRFRTEHSVAFNDGATANYSGDVNYHRGKPNGFASAGLRIFEPVSLIADWYGQDLALGVSIVPFMHLPLVVTPAISDVTRSAGDGPRFTLGAGLDFRFASLLHPGF